MSATFKKESQCFNHCVKSIVLSFENSEQSAWRTSNMSQVGLPGQLGNREENQFVFGPLWLLFSAIFPFVIRKNFSPSMCFINVKSFALLCWQSFGGNSITRYTSIGKIINS